MSREKTIKDGIFHVAHEVEDPMVHRLEVALGRAYDAGYLEGSGQSSITALEREVIVAALEFFNGTQPFIDNLRSATLELHAALEREATE